MAEAAEESGKEKYSRDRACRRKFLEAEREFPAAREATEKEIIVAEKPREEVCREKSRGPPQHPAFLYGKMMVVSGRRFTWHGRVYFQTEAPTQGKRPQLRSRLEEGFRGRPRRLIVRTALPRRHSPDSRQLVISSAKELFF